MAKAKKDSEKKPAKVKPEKAPAEKKSRAKEWEDMKAGKVQQAPREGAVLDIALKLMDSKKNGATLEEIQAKLDAAKGEGKHHVARLLRWANVERGYGFSMDEKTKRVTYSAPNVKEPKKAAKDDE